ncbi:dihydrofolate reductase-like [Gigantopelta aegis]|uniref:dihydrofolate reductase-like n=1 Tax=Gigantopelta aegis TaxID=1735272 RepID=UPI001B88E265|nr:dihydrofolate reductase-like [Gigantopelta aegis]
MTAKQLNVIVAACNNHGIGIDGKLPWRLKKDMAMFKMLTTKTNDENKQNAVIMGRKTWSSIPEKFRPLANRVNIVLSTSMKDSPLGAHLTGNFEEAMRLISDGDLSSVVESVFIIGGSSVYSEAMKWPKCRVYLTRVLSDFHCDTFFPDISDEIFKKTDNPEWLPDTPQQDGDITFVYEVYDKL